MAKTKQKFFTPSNFVDMCLNAEHQKIGGSMSYTINKVLEDIFTERARLAMMSSGDIEE